MGGDPGAPALVFATDAGMAGCGPAAGAYSGKEAVVIVPVAIGAVPTAGLANASVARGDPGAPLFVFVTDAGLAHNGAAGAASAGREVVIGIASAAAVAIGAVPTARLANASGAAGDPGAPLCVGVTDAGLAHTGAAGAASSGREVVMGIASAAAVAIGAGPKARLANASGAGGDPGAPLFDLVTDAGLAHNGAAGAASSGREVVIGIASVAITVFNCGMGARTGSAASAMDASTRSLEDIAWVQPTALTRPAGSVAAEPADASDTSFFPMMSSNKASSMPSARAKAIRL